MIYLRDSSMGFVNTCRYRRLQAKSKLDRDSCPPGLDSTYVSGKGKSLSIQPQPLVGGACISSFLRQELGSL